MRAGVRKSYGGSSAGGGNRVSVEGPMRRRCPKCDAAPGWRCGRYVGVLWEPIKGLHKERQGDPAVSSPRVLVDATAVEVCLAVVAEVERAATEVLLSEGRCGPTALPSLLQRRGAGASGR